LAECPLSWHPKMAGKYGTDECMRERCAWWTGEECAARALARVLPKP